MLKIETTSGPRNKFHSIPTESFAVYSRDHLRSNLGIFTGLGIICGRGSFAALYSSDDLSALIEFTPL